LFSLLKFLLKLIPPPLTLTGR